MATLTGSGMLLGPRILDCRGVTLLLLPRCVWRASMFVPKIDAYPGVQDKTVLIWTKDSAQAPWVKTVLDPTTLSPSAATTNGAGKFPDVVWRVSWSLAGNILAVSCGDGKVTLWKENLKGGWECVSDVTS